MAEVRVFHGQKGETFAVHYEVPDLGLIQNMASADGQEAFLNHIASTARNAIFEHIKKNELADLLCYACGTNKAAAVYVASRYSDNTGGRWTATTLAACRCADEGCFIAVRDSIATALRKPDEKQMEFKRECYRCDKEGHCLELQYSQLNIAVVVCMACHSTVCHYCAKQSKDEQRFNCCAACKVSAYCNRECQKRDWKLGGHKQRCDQLKAFVNKINSV